MALTAEERNEVLLMQQEFHKREVLPLFKAASEDAKGLRHEVRNLGQTLYEYLHIMKGRTEQQGEDAELSRKKADEEREIIAQKTELRDRKLNLLLALALVILTGLLVVVGYLAYINGKPNGRAALTAADPSVADYYTGDLQ